MPLVVEQLSQNQILMLISVQDRSELLLVLLIVE